MKINALMNLKNTLPQIFLCKSSLVLGLPLVGMTLGGIFCWKKIRQMSKELMDKNQLLDLLEKDLQHVSIVIDVQKYKIKYAPSNVDYFIEQADFEQIKKDLKASAILLKYLEEEAYQELLKGFYKAQQGEQHAFYIKAKNQIQDENKWFQVSFNNLDEKNIIVFLQDVTGVYQQKVQLKRALQQAQIAQQAKTQFLANISHEMRTPMNAIIGLTEIGIKNATKKGCSDCEQKLRNVEKVSGHLLELINNLLDMEKISSGKATLNETVFYLPNLVEDIVQMMGQRLKEKQQAFILQMDESIERYVKGDELRLKQVIINLLSNANKFTLEEGKITWEMEAISKSEGIELKMTIQDTGIGIEKKDQHKIFNAFEQVGQRYIGAYEGTGLGLPITKEIVELMNGKLELESELGVGSRFKVSVLLKKAEESSKLPCEASQENRQHIISDERIEKKKRILLVDDVQLNRMIVEELLSEYPYSIETATNGLECLEKFKVSSEGYYDIILMDIQMPLLNGYEATQAIRKLKHPDAHKVAIIAMSANAYEEDREQAEKSGMNDYISKPISFEKLITMLRRY